MTLLFETFLTPTPRET